jgi:predicted transcriptional regulator
MASFAGIENFIPLWLFLNGKVMELSKANAPSDGHDDSEPADESSLRAEMARSLARGGMPGVQVISWETADKILSPKRRELIETLQGGDVESVRGLARQLDRDKGQVSRDLGTLSEHGIVRFEESGRAKKPVLTQKHIVIEPVV